MDACVSTVLGLGKVPNVSLGLALGLESISSNTAGLSYLGLVIHTRPPAVLGLSTTQRSSSVAHAQHSASENSERVFGSLISSR